VLPVGAQLSRRVRIRLSRVTTTRPSRATTGIQSRSGVPTGTSGRSSCPGYTTSSRPARRGSLPRPRVFSSVKYTGTLAAMVRQRARHQR
jgi:hypothetical protein